METTKATLTCVLYTLKIRMSRKEGGEERGGHHKYMKGAGKEVGRRFKVAGTTTGWRCLVESFHLR